MLTNQCRALEGDEDILITGRDLQAILDLASQLRAADRPMNLDQKLDWGNRLHLIVQRAEDITGIAPV